MKIIQIKKHKEGVSIGNESIFSFGKLERIDGKHRGYYFLFTFPIAFNRKYISTFNFKEEYGPCYYNKIFRLDYVGNDKSNKKFTTRVVYIPKFER